MVKHNQKSSVCIFFIAMAIIHQLNFLWATIALTILVLGCPTPILSQRAIDPTLQGQIDDYIQNNFLPSNNITSLGLAIVQNDGEIFYSTGYGMANIEKGIANGNMTQFLIGSITKSFVGVLTAKLIHEKFPVMYEDEGLDTPISKLIPEANFTLIDRFRSERVTFRDLLAHRVCTWPDNLFLYADPFNSTEDIFYRSRYSIEAQDGTGRDCGIRSQLVYNNQMYVVAGELISYLAGKSFEEAAQDLLNDLGMFNSSFTKRTDDFSQMDYRAQPYYVKDDKVHPGNEDLVKRVTLGNAAGGLFATPNDMARYMRFHLNKGELDGVQIIPEEVMEWLTKPSNIYPGFSFKKREDDNIINSFAYGLGLIISSYDSWEYIQHGGYFPPYGSQMSLFPEKKLAIFTSTNMGPVSQSQILIHSAIHEILNGNGEKAVEKANFVQAQLKSENEKEKMKNKMKLEKFIEKNAKPLLLEERKYGSGFQGEFEIIERLDENNETEYYFSYGRWYKGVLQVENVVIGHLIYDTDAIQDEYLQNFQIYVVTIDDGPGNKMAILQIFEETEELIFAGIFEEGLSLDKLPPIPWDPNSC